MTDQITVQLLKTQLFAGTRGTAFAILDGASIPGLPGHLFTFRPEHACLYIGDLKPDMAEVAPYLVALDMTAPFTDWVLANGWGAHWGIFGASETGLRELRNHFRRFLTVYDTSGKPLFFRFYDPRVLRDYLPTCTARELKSLFGPVTSYLVEDEQQDKAVRFSFNGRSLRQQSLPLKQG